IYVDIKGEVLFPGVYQVQNGVRIYQVIALAGGLTSLASTWELNLSTIVTDQMVILISKKEDTQVDVTSSFSFKVFIGGEVIQPGQYYVEKTDTLRDLINMAGGLSIDALTTNLLFDMPL
ncbi:MAG: SLBB domain-containing protein, partial [Bacteroidales bacterium]|nr:SLBB domain-containing protein [Bacteroidales bacterium]